MAKPKARLRPLGDHPFVVAILLLAALATIAAFVRGCQSERESGVPLILRVSGEDGSSVSGASALLFYVGGAFSQFTDSNGVATFAYVLPAADHLRLIVEHERYEIYESQIQRRGDEVISIRLKERSPTSSNVILRVVGADGKSAIDKAEVAVVTAGALYRDVTDSDGFATFTLGFPPEGRIDARISVTARDYQIEDQISTLLPGRLQYILLSPTSLVVQLPTFPTPQAQPLHTGPEIGESPQEASSGIELTYLQSGEGIKVALLDPDSTPWEDAHVEVFQQVPDVSGNPAQGERLASGWIGPQGEVDFEVSEGMYSICLSQAPGYGWPEGPCAYGIEVKPGQTVRVQFQVGSLEIAILGADGKAWTGVFYEVYTQRDDVSGNPVTDRRVVSGSTDNRGLGEEWLTRGLYDVHIDLRGYNWGSLSDKEGEANVEVRPGQAARLTIELGQLEIGLTDSDGRPETDVFLEIYTQGTAVDGSPTLLDRIWSGQTDNGGFARVDLTAGTYALKRGDEVLYGIPLIWGEITRTDGESIE